MFTKRDMSQDSLANSILNQYAAPDFQLPRLTMVFDGRNVLSPEAARFYSATASTTEEMCFFALTYSSRLMPPTPSDESDFGSSFPHVDDTGLMLFPLTSISYKDIYRLLLRGDMTLLLVRGEHPEVELDVNKSVPYFQVAPDQEYLFQCLIPSMHAELSRGDNDAAPALTMDDDGRLSIFVAKAEDSDTEYEVEEVTASDDDVAVSTLRKMAAQQKLPILDDLSVFGASIFARCQADDCSYFVPLFPNNNSGTKTFCYPQTALDAILGEGSLDVCVIDHPTHPEFKKVATACGNTILRHDSTEFNRDGVYNFADKKRFSFPPRVIENRKLYNRLTAAMEMDCNIPKSAVWAERS